MSKEIKYSGAGLTGMDVSLFGMQNPFIDGEKSLDNIVKGFKQDYGSAVRKAFSSIGMQVVGYNSYSPKQYNYEGDDITIVLRVSNKNTLKKAIIRNKNEIQKVLNTNRSYSGYVSHTVETVEEELERIKEEGYEPDILVLAVLLRQKVKFPDEENTRYWIEEHLVYMSKRKAREENGWSAKELREEMEEWGVY